MANAQTTSSILHSTPREKLRTAGVFALAATLTFTAIAINVVRSQSDARTIIQNAGIGILISMVAVQVTRKVIGRLQIGERIQNSEMGPWLAEFDKALGTSSSFNVHRLKRLKNTAAYINDGNHDVIATSLDEATTPEIERKGITAHEVGHRHKGHMKEVQNWHHWMFAIALIEPEGGVIASGIVLAVIRRNELQADRISADLTGDGYHLARFLTRSERKANTPKPSTFHKVVDGTTNLAALHPSSQRRAKALLARSPKFIAIKKQFGLSKA